MPRLIRLVLPLVMTLAVLPAAAQTGTVFGGARADVSAPVEISADVLSVHQVTGRAEFTGNVLIGQGEMRLSADRVVVQYAEGDRSRIQTLEADGNVTLISAPDAAEAQRAVYDVATGKIVLTGNVLLTQGQNVLSGERVDVNLADGTAQATGRVRSVLQPGGN
ncbi:MAG: lipopolysaccharide transport periplasmic protein LptA [Paracoccus sp. (in: a-proteobacteria)]|nr:lipopolysaccharide transport periplasmic protein LptA [Paracoccus sp. (in: a-proteobacteria)]